MNTMRNHQYRFVRPFTHVACMFAKKDIIGQWDDRRLITTIYYFRIPVVDVNVYQHQDLLRNKYLGPPANRIVPNAQGINIPNSLGWMDNRIETGKKTIPTLVFDWWSAFKLQIQSLGNVFSWDRETESSTINMYFMDIKYRMFWKLYNFTFEAEFCDFALSLRKYS